MNAPLPSALKARLPEFADVNDAIIQAALDDAASWVGYDWDEADQTSGMIYFAAHMMELRGLKPKAPGMAGMVTEAKRAGVSEITSGPLKVRFTEGAGGSSGANANGAPSLSKTIYGELYLAIQSRWHRSPRIV